MSPLGHSVLWPLEPIGSFVENTHFGSASLFYPVERFEAVGSSSGIAPNEAGGPF